jgi:hypothetical protein
MKVKAYQFKSAQELAATSYVFKAAEQDEAITISHVDDDGFYGQGVDTGLGYYIPFDTVNVESDTFYSLSINTYLK